jgi:hypothetical protein
VRWCWTRTDYSSGRQRAWLEELRGRGEWPAVAPSVILAEALTGDHRRDYLESRMLRAWEIESLDELLARSAARLRAAARTRRTPSAVDAIVVAVAGEAGGAVVLSSDPADQSVLPQHTSNQVVPISSAARSTSSVYSSRRAGAIAGVPRVVPGRVIRLIAHMLGQLRLQHGLQHLLGQVRQQAARAHQAGPIGPGPGQQLISQIASRDLPSQRPPRCRLHHRRQLRTIHRLRHYHSLLDRAPTRHARLVVTPLLLHSFGRARLTAKPLTVVDPSGQGSVFDR